MWKPNLKTFLAEIIMTSPIISNVGQSGFVLCSKVRDEGSAGGLINLFTMTGLTWRTALLL